jgi:TatD DNase family protein
MINSNLYIDIHTHHASTHSTFCLLVGDHVKGLHPWDLSKDLHMEDAKRRFEDLQGQPMLAIGECGLDRRRVGIYSIGEQLEVFSWHVELAKKLKKPLVVHCVHAESDLLAFLKNQKFLGPILLHDFKGNSRSLDHFKNYDVYYSFGARLFRDDKKYLDFFKQVPLQKLFLETDDQIQYSIQDIYSKACEILSIPESLFSGQMEKNLKRFFGYADDVCTADIVKDLTLSS